MKILSIGDTHGKDIAPFVRDLLPTYDKAIFVGDYVDSFEIPDSDILYSLLNIISLKKEFPDKVELLLGNHDLQYMYSSAIHRCSGFRTSMFASLFELFNDNKDLFQGAYQVKNTLWTHAGVHAGWYKQRFHKFSEMYPDLNIAQQLNLALKSYEQSLFDIGHIRWGNHNQGGPFWCDKSELTSKPLKGVDQIVGHTRRQDILRVEKYGQNLVFIDILEDTEELEDYHFYTIHL